MTDDTNRPIRIAIVPPGRALRTVDKGFADLIVEIGVDGSSRVAKSKIHDGGPLNVFPGRDVEFLPTIKAKMSLRTGKLDE